MSSLEHYLSDPIRLRVNFDLPFMRLVEDANYAWVDGELNSQNFSTNRTGLVDTWVRMLSFDRLIGIDGLFGVMKRLQLPGADPRLMVQLSTEQPEIETRSQLVSPGMIIEQTGRFSGRRLLSFWIGDHKRHLGYGRWGKESWLAGTKFLVEAE